MWLHHLLNLLASAGSIFFDAIGTTLLGRIVDLAFVISVAAVALRATHSKDGWIAMLNHWKQDYRGPMRFTLWCSLVIYGPIIVWSVGKAVYEDHEGLVRRSHDQRQTISSDAATLEGNTTDFNKKLTDCGTQKATLIGTSAALTNQNRDQQNSINNCQTQAIKLLTPTAQKTTGMPIEQSDGGRDADGKQLVKARFLLITNKLVSPVDMNITCDHSLANVDLYPIPIITHGGTESRISDTQWEARVAAAWAPEAPLMADVLYYGEQGVKTKAVCRFDLR